LGETLFWTYRLASMANSATPALDQSGIEDYRWMGLQRRQGKTAWRKSLEVQYPRFTLKSRQGDDLFRKKIQRKYGRGVTYMSTNRERGSSCPQYRAHTFAKEQRSGGPDPKSSETRGRGRLVGGYRTLEQSIIYRNTWI